MSRASFVLCALCGVSVACGGGSGAGRPRATASSGGAGGGETSGTGGYGALGSGGATTGDPGGNQTTALATDCAEPALGSPELRLLTRGELVATLSDIFPELAGQWSESLPAGALSAQGFDNSASTTVGVQLAEGILDTAESVATAVVGTLPTLLPCSTTSPDRACAEQFVSTFGRRLFRRALTAEERERYLAFFDSAFARFGFEPAIKWTTVGLIQSPNAVYRREIGTDAGDGTRHLSDLELATELSYTFTGSTPSEELLTAAEGGALGDPVALAEGMLQTEPGKQALQRFFEGYVAYSDVPAIQRPSIPEFSNVSADMVQETRAFIDQVLFQGGGGVTQLLTAPTTNPSQALAGYYGISAPASDYAPVARTAGVGILAQGSFLATHANADGSSPTKRGLFPFLKLLCQVKPKPPPNVPQIGAPEPGVRTTRQRYEEVHGQIGSPCATCHKAFDPIGFGFEHFDEGGRYRTDESGLTIDASATVTDFDGNVLFSFDGQEDLMAKLSELPVVHRCFSAYLAAYAFGSTQACLGSNNAAELEAGSIGIAQAFAELAAAPHFSRRTLE